MFIIPLPLFFPARRVGEGGGGYGVPPPRKPPGSMGGNRLFHFPAAQWLYCQRGYLFLEACSIYNREGPEAIGGVLNCSSASETGRLRTEQQTDIGVCLMETEKFLKNFC